MADSDPLEWETLDSKVAYTCPGFDIVNETVRLPDGTETDFDHLSEPPAVVIVPFTPDDDLVVIEEWRQAVGRVNRGLPAGCVEDEDADLDAAARRELEEETGYEAGWVDHLTTVEPANGVADAVHHYFLARDCVPTGERNLDVDESIRAETTTFDAFRSDLAAGAVRDGRAALGVLYYGAFGAE